MGGSKESKVPVDLEVGLEWGDCVKGGVPLDSEEEEDIDVAF